jgi:hypothetical protein
LRCGTRFRRNAALTFEHYENAQAAFQFKASAFDPRNANVVADWFRQHR